MEVDIFYYMFMPLHRHIDFGFGATGDAFRQAAERLLADKETSNFFNAHMPINFLFRHAIELYLKSLIIVIHKSLRLPFGDKLSDETPSVKLGERWKPIYQVHSVEDLYSYFKKLIYTKKSEIQSMAKTDLTAIPAELDGWIKQIDKLDRMSTLFRYPVTRNQKGDHEKSGWKEIPEEELGASTQPGERGKNLFILVDDDYSVVSAYQYDEEALKQLHEALKGAADLLSGAHCGMRVELADGK